MPADRASGAVIDAALVDAESGRLIDVSQRRARPGPGFRAESWASLLPAGHTGKNPL